MDSFCHVWSRSRILMTLEEDHWYISASSYRTQYHLSIATGKVMMPLNAIIRLEAVWCAAVSLSFFCRFSILQVSVGFLSPLCSQCLYQNQLQTQYRKQLGLRTHFGHFLLQRKLTLEHFNLSTTIREKASKVSIIFFSVSGTFHVGL